MAKERKSFSPPNPPSVWSLHHRPIAVNVCGVGGVGRCSYSESENTLSPSSSFHGSWAEGTRCGHPRWAICGKLKRKVKILPFGKAGADCCCCYNTLQRYNCGADDRELLGRYTGWTRVENGSIWLDCASQTTTITELCMCETLLQPTTNGLRRWETSRQPSATIPEPN